MSPGCGSDTDSTKISREFGDVDPMITPHASVSSMQSCRYSSQISRTSCGTETIDRLNVNVALFLTADVTFGV